MWLVAILLILLCFIPASSSSCCTLEKNLEQSLQCQDTLSLYRQALKMTLNSLDTDRERRIMKEVLCLICASHNGVSESEVLDLFPEMESPFLTSLLHRLTRVYVVTLRCGLIRFQHLQVNTPPPPPSRPMLLTSTCRGCHEGQHFSPYLCFFARLGRP